MIRGGPILAVLLPLFVSGCSDPSVGGRDGGLGDGSCGPGHTVTSPHGRLVVATEAYGSGGGITVIDLDTLESHVNVALTHDDVTVRWWNGMLWVLNRFGADNIMVLDGQDFRLLKQFSVKPAPDEACNPQDLVFLSTCRVLLSCYEQASVYLLNPQAPLGQELEGEIDLSSLADADGLPEISHMAEVNGQVYVSVQRMNRDAGWVPSEPSYLAVLDPEALALADTITLSSVNPVGPLRRLLGTRELVTAMAGDLTGQGAGLERIDTDTGLSELALTATELGGLVNAFTLDASGCGHAVVMTPQVYDYGLTHFCLDGSSVETCVDFGLFKLTDVVEVDDGRLVVTDAAYTTPGVRIYDSASCTEVTTEPIPTGFGPGFTTPLLLLPPAE